MMDLSIEGVVTTLANRLHANWAATYWAEHGQGAPRWREMTAQDALYIEQRPYPAGVTRRNGRLMELNIAALTNEQLPPSFGADNLAAARGVIQAILAHPGQPVDFYASIVHVQWLERWGHRATDDQKKDFDHLSEPEKEKDRVIVRAAFAVLRRAGLVEATT